MRLNLTADEREMFYVKWDIPPESKQRRRLQLSSILLSDPLNMHNVSESAEVVARLESEIKLITFGVPNSMLIFSSMKMKMNLQNFRCQPVGRDLTFSLLYEYAYKSTANLVLHEKI
ncbi:hypothetical protein CQW23_06480 [Capsicum baccatum]|uniref:NPK1-activating kinesin-like protein C-terminal domain-containing protein n=1 Tax=Capsicum baccatum TaxID=33114 RepID=A0A2G2X3F6_CAPBA|nr:hypothetical protein CQW23_06480 [Capsicum baccatum]